MKVRIGLTMVAVATAVAVLPIGASGKPPAPASATFLSALKRADGGKRASMKVTYSCPKGDTLWISAKETKSGKRDKRLKQEGSSAIAHTWLQSHRNPITCDGAAHTGRFKVDKVEKGSKGHLVKGQAWVQFCITLNQKKLILSKSGWVKVR